MKATTTENNPQSVILKHCEEETIDSFSRWTSTALSKFPEVVSQAASKVRTTLDKSNNSRGELENFQYPSSPRNKEQLNIINMRKHKINNAIVNNSSLQIMISPRISNFPSCYQMQTCPILQENLAYQQKMWLIIILQKIC